MGVLVRSAALSGKSRLDQEAPALSYRLFREEMAGDELLGILGIGMATPADFVALLSAWALDQSLLEEHDEDYFDNPQAIERLRDEMASVPAVHHSLQSVQPGVTLLLGDVEQAF